MSTQAEGGQSSQSMYATNGKKKGKGKQKPGNYEESEDGIERWNRRIRIVRLHELLPPCSTSDAYELVKLVGDFYHAEAFEMQKRSRSTTFNISQNANDFFMDSMSNVSSLIEWASGDLQLPDIDNLLEGDECWHCGRKDDEGGGRRRGEGAAAQAILDADPYPLPSEFDLVDPEAPGAIEAVIARAMAEDEDLQRQQEGILDGRQDMEEVIEEREEDEAMGGEDTSQAAQSCSDTEDAGNEMGAVEDMDGAEDSDEAMALDEINAGGGETLVEENERSTRELDTLREELSKTNELNKDLSRKLDVAHEEIDRIREAPAVNALNAELEVSRTKRDDCSKALVDAQAALAGAHNKLAGVVQIVKHTLGRLTYKENLGSDFYCHSDETDDGSEDMDYRPETANLDNSSEGSDNTSKDYSSQGSDDTETTDRLMIAKLRKTTARITSVKFHPTKS